ncbi:MAG: Fe-S cluster assembly protein SufD [Pseudomonadota bacterium]
MTGNRTAATPDTDAAGLAGRVRELAGQATFPSWLADLRSRALSELAQAEFPGRKSEPWKYTRLTALENSGALGRTATIVQTPVPAAALPALDAWRLVFVNGRYDAAQSSLPADGSLVVSPLIGLADAEQAGARELLTRADTPPLPFSTFNRAAFHDGLYVRVPKDAQPAKPLHVVFHTEGTEPATSQARLLIQVETQARLTLVEQYTAAAATQYTNAASVIDLARGARLAWMRVQLDDQYFTGSAQLRQQADSHCDAWLLSRGSRLKRNDIVCTLAAPGAGLTVKGAFLAGAGEHIDNQVAIEHAAPHGTSQQVFKGLAGGDGRAVFNGRIHIHPGAKQTSAGLVNNNLLLSADAEIDTKPELEIYNDDVKCAHGATVGRLNETAVFYLQSRGVARADAELMLALGFVNELIDSLPLPELAVWLRAACADWFAARGARRNSGVTP